MIPNANIILAGPMGSGKTSVGEIVARMLRREFRDTDRMIEEITGISIVRIFSERSEAYFRYMENEVAKMIGEQRNLVVAVGGGMTVPDENFETLKSSGLLICLFAKEEELIYRLENQDNRPLLRGGELKSRLHKILIERHDSYNRMPYRIDTDGLTIEQVASEVVELYTEQVGNA